MHYWCVDRSEGSQYRRKSYTYTLFESKHSLAFVLQNLLYGKKSYPAVSAGLNTCRLESHDSLRFLIKLALLLSIGSHSREHFKNFLSGCKDVKNYFQLNLPIAVFRHIHYAVLGVVNGICEIAL